MSDPSPQHRGAGMNAITELEARSVIIRGLHELASDPENLEAMVRRTDLLLSGSQVDWARELRAELMAMLTPTSDRYVRVGVGWPTSHAHLPYVSLVNASGGENEGEAFIGDILGDASFEKFGEYTPPDALPSGLKLTPTPAQMADPTLLPKPIQIEEIRSIGTGWRTRLEIGSWHVAPEGSILLHAAVRWALFRGKREFEEMGAHETSLSEGGVMPDERLEPRIGYVPMTSLDILWTYKQIERSAAIPGNVSCNFNFSS